MLPRDGQVAGCGLRRRYQSQALDPRCGFEAMNWPAALGALAKRGVTIPYGASGCRIARTHPQELENHREARESIRRCGRIALASEVFLVRFPGVVHPGNSLFYVFGKTMIDAGFAMLCGEPGAWLTLVEVTVNTYSLPALRLIA